MARVVNLKEWRKFLKACGLELIRTRGGHEIWDLPDDSLERPVIFSAHYKEIAIFQIGTNLETMGKTMEDLDEFLGRGRKKK